MRSGIRIGAMQSLIVAACFTAVASAHHSTAEFDYTKEVTIKGTVKEVQWTNPHSYIQLIADGEGGEKIQWSVEIGSPSLNVNMGWRKNSVKVGDVVTMNLSPARNGKPYGTLRVLDLCRWRRSSKAWRPEWVQALVGRRQRRPPPSSAAKEP